jgi:hypothetical protein
MPTITAGSLIRARDLTDLDGHPVHLPDSHAIVHLQFRRFAGCPWCNLHLHSVAARYQEIQAAGVREVVVFNSTAADLLSYQGNPPFPVIADPTGRLYREFGVGLSARSILDPRAWPSGVRAIRAQRHQPPAADGRRHPLFPGRAMFRLPADLLVGPDGRVLARHDGSHAADQWSVTELLDLADQARRADS